MSSGRIWIWKNMFKISKKPIKSQSLKNPAFSEQLKYPLFVDLNVSWGKKKNVSFYSRLHFWEPQIYLTCINKGLSKQFKEYLSGCNASSSAWSQGPCTTWWPHSLSFHHLYVEPVRNPRSKGEDRSRHWTVQLSRLVKWEGKYCSAN